MRTARISGPTAHVRWLLALSALYGMPALGKEMAALAAVELADKTEQIALVKKRAGAAPTATGAPGEVADDGPDVRAAPFDDTALAALDLADRTSFATVKKKKLIAMAEVASFVTDSGGNEQRASLDLRWDTPLMGGLAENWRVVLSNRLDSRFDVALGGSRSINALREAYVTYRPAPGTSIDVGRVNTRYGVALGYNPTDFLGRGTVRSVVSADPETLRSNRLGNAMIRWQQLSDKASVTAIVSPKLGRQPSDSGGSLDWGASNPRSRVLLAGSYRFADNLNPQWLLLHEAGRSPQFGFNFSRVLSRSALFYAEWAGGRQPLSWQASLPDSRRDIAWRNRLASGAAWTGENGLTLRVEAHYDGSADSRRALVVAASAPQPLMARGGADADGFARHAVEWIAPRRSVLVQGYWKDVIAEYDLNLIVQRDLQRQRNMAFAELRRHLGPVDLALQWQKTYRLDGNAAREVRMDQRWQASLRYYF